MACDYHRRWHLGHGRFTARMTNPDTEQTTGGRLLEAYPARMSGRPVWRALGEAERHARPPAGVPGGDAPLVPFRVSQGAMRVRAAPLISIVVPCCNHGHFLAEALRSVTTSLPTEIIVVDDGSTDATADVLATLETPHALRSVTQPNGGLAQARNRGLRESRGRVVFLDADDRLARAASDLGATALDDHPGVRSFRPLHDDGPRRHPAHDSPLPEDPARSLPELLRRNYIWTPAVAMFRREAVERAGFNPKVNAAADYELYLHIARHHPAYDHGAIVAHDRRHDENMSGNAGRMLRETLEVLWSQRAFLEADAASLTAYCEGLRLWRDFYDAQSPTRSARTCVVMSGSARSPRLPCSPSIIRAASGITSHAKRRA